MAVGPEITQYLEAALKATSLRSRTIANNIANLQTPGYRRRTVQFEKLLANAVDSGRKPTGDELEPRITQPNDTPIGKYGSDVVLEKEIGDMIKNSAMYKTYLKLMAKAYQQMEMAIADK